MKLLGLVLFLFFCTHTYAQSVETKQLQDFKQNVGRSHIIGLGESSHGYETINQAKAIFLQVLQKDMGVDAIVFESSYTLSIVSFVTDKTTDSRARHFLYPFWNTASVTSALLPFLEKEHEKPWITGFDIQEDCRFTQLSKVLLDRKLIVDGRSKLLQCDSILSYYIGEKFTRQPPLSDSEYLLLSHHYEAIQRELNQTKFDTLHTKLLKWCITNRLWLCKYLTLRSVAERMHYRDSLMAQNVVWLKQELYKESKMALWSADTHIAKSANTKQVPKWMGEWLQRIYGRDYYAVLFKKCSAGEAFLWRDMFVNYGKGVAEKFNLSICLGSLVKIHPAEWMTSCD